MSMTPSTPTNLGDELKSFWARPEGKTGMIFIVLAAAALVYGWGMIVPFIVSMLADTLHMIYLASILAAVLFVIFSSRTHLLFRLLMRWITGMIINIDPIGILKDHLSQMRKRRDVISQEHHRQEQRPGQREHAPRRARQENRYHLGRSERATPHGVAD